MVSSVSHAGEASTRNASSRLSKPESTRSPTATSSAPISALPPLMRLGLPDAFPHKYGVQEDLFEVYGLTPEQIAAAVVKIAKKEKVA